MASGMSAAIVSRIGLPLSQVSASGESSRFSSMRSAILFRILARSAGEVLPQASLALCAASSASSMSSACERAISQTVLPVIGRDVVEIAALDRRDPFAADEIVVAGPQRHA